MTGPSIVLRGLAFAKAEADYITLRRTKSPQQARMILGVDPDSNMARRFEESYTFQRHGNGRDTSCPKFAFDDQHVADVSRAGGFSIIDWPTQTIVVRR